MSVTSAIINLINFMPRQEPIINSPVFKAVSCIPFVGFVSSTFADLVTIANFIKNEEEKSVARQIAVFRIYKEYRKIDIVRNLLDVTLLVGGIALGVFSSPHIGLLLVGACVIFAMFHANEITKADYKINTLRPRACS